MRDGNAERISHLFHPKGCRCRNRSSPINVLTLLNPPAEWYAEHPVEHAEPSAVTADDTSFRYHRSRARA